ncbi:MAG: peptidylprolyl isomerase [Actinomycetota bacterium]|nr:peptidylprolyl isomerase [Actinomycetota bacterium]
MGKADKRARQKERRAAIAAAQRSAAQRRRIIRAAVVGVLLLGVIGLALFTGNDESDEGGGTAACGADAPEAASPHQYDSPPPMRLEEGVDYGAVMETSCGSFEMDLLEDEAPETVNNFVFLARENFYDGLTFHRIEDNQVIQGGDPEGTGQGGPGYAIPDELPESRKDYVYGTVGMANSGPDTGGSQFFVVVRDPDPEGGFEPAGYPPNYSIFGEVDPGDEQSVQTLTRISTRPVAGGQDPAAATVPEVPVYIEDVKITEA